LLTVDQSGRCILTIDQHAEPVTTVAWAPDGESFVTASLDKHTQLCLWSVNGRPLYNWALDYRIQHCAISPDGRRLVTISVERQIFVYNFVTREEQYSILVKSDMTSLSISRDSRYMLINMTENEVHMIDIETADIVRKFVGQKQGKFVIRSAFGGADENLVVSGSEGEFFCSCHSLEPLLIPPL
jgi:WD40 repeat protein